MDRLHRGDDAVAGEARQIGRIDDLGMLDPPAPVAPIGGGKLLDRVEQSGIGLVADRVDRDLEIVHRRPAHQILEHGVVDQGQAALAGRVAIGLLQPGAARAERAVEIELHADHPEPPVIEPGRRPGAGDGEQIVDPRGVGEDPDAQRPASPARRITAQSSPLVPMSATRGEAVGEQDLLRPRRAPGRAGAAAAAASRARPAPSPRRRRCRSGSRPVRSIRPPAGAWLCGGDPGLAHRHAVRPAGMAVDPLEPDRPVGDDGVEIGGGREAAEAPALLVPAAADDPARGRVGGGIGADPRLRLLRASWCRRGRARARPGRGP